jgi:hemolysin activation/secretion protein
MNKNRQLTLLGICLVAPFMAIAQETGSRIERRFETPPEPKSTLQPLVFPIDESSPPEQAAQLRFTLKELSIKGSTVFSSEELAPLYTSLVGKEVTLLDIYQLRDAITAKYGSAGFGLSKAVIPEQRIQAEGLVRIDVIEGFVDEVLIEGGSDEQHEFLTYASDEIKAERPLNARTLERYLLLANDRYAIKVTATLKASEKTPAASSLILKVETAPQLEGGATFDNRGTQQIGPNEVYVNLSINGLGGRASQTTLAYATTSQTSELQYVSIFHTEVLSNEGTFLTLGWINSLSKPGTTALRLLDNKSDVETWSLKLAHPFLRTRQENLTASVKYEQQDTDNKYLDVLTIQDKVRALRFGLNYDKADAYQGVNQALLQYSFGLQGLGATSHANPLRSRLDAEEHFQKLAVSLSRNQELAYFSPLLSKFSVYAAFMGQYSGKGLLSSEECGIGGQQFGRAYDPSEILGDSCLAGSLEFRYTPNTMGTPFKNAQFYGWYDGGSTTNHTALSAFDAKTKSLSSTGLGVRFGLGPYLSAYMEAAQPLTRTVANEGNNNTRFFGSISARF